MFISIDPTVNKQRPAVMQ